MISDFKPGDLVRENYRDYLKPLRVGVVEKVWDDRSLVDVIYQDTIRDEKIILRKRPSHLTIISPRIWSFDPESYFDPHLMEKIINRIELNNKFCVSDIYEERKDLLKRAGQRLREHDIDYDWSWM